MSGRNFRVDIIDPIGVTTWQAGTKYIAKEMYFHPFVWGYNPPTYTGEDGA